MSTDDNLGSNESRPKSLVERVKNSRYWPYLTAISACVTLALGVPSAVVSFQQAIGAGESADSASRQLIATEQTAKLAVQAANSAREQAEATRAIADSIAKQLAIAIEQNKIAEQQAKSLSDLANSASEAARISTRQAAAAEASAIQASKQADLMAVANQQQTRARLELVSLRSIIKVGEEARQVIKIKKVGAGLVTNLRMIVKPNLHDREIQQEQISCEDPLAYRTSVLTDQDYFGKLPTPLTAKELSDLLSGRKAFTMYGAFCYDDEHTKNLRLPFCGIVTGQWSEAGGAEYC